MRHGKKFNHLGRTTSHRKAMLANMSCSLIESKRINTTLAKAKALRQYVEPLFTKSKDDSTNSRRVVFGYLQNKEAVSELFREIAPKIAERNGGYTRILKTGNRLGDNAEMCFIELVDFNETYISEGKDKKTTRRSRRGGKTSLTSEEKTSSSTPVKKADKNTVEDSAVEVETKETEAQVEVVETVSEETIDTPEVEENKATEDSEKSGKEVEAKGATTEEPKEDKAAEEKEEESKGEDKEKKD